MHLDGYGCAGASATRYGLACQELEAGDSGLRSLRLRAGLAGDVRDLALRGGGAEAGVAAADGRRRGDRLLRADRARRRLATPARCAPRAKRDGRRLGPQRHEDVDHERLARRRGGRVGAHRRRRARLPRPARHARLHDAGHPPEAVAARLGDLRAGPRRRPRCRPPPLLPEARGAARAAGLPERGALRDRVRRDRRRARVLRGGARVRRGARAVRQADRRRSSSRRRSSPRCWSRSTRARCSRCTSGA